VAKKQRSAKQKAATRKLVARNRRKSKPKRRKSSKTRKPNKRRSPSRSTAKKRSKSRGKTSFIDKIPILKNKTVQKIGFGLGMGSIAGIAARNIPVPAVQQNADLIATGVAFATEPLAGVVRLALSGGLGQLGNLFGGQGGGGNGGGSNGGFA